MQSKQKPYLRLVWPPQGPAELDVDSWSTLEAALRSDGWRSVTPDDLRSLPPDYLCIVKGFEDPTGRVTYWLKAAPKEFPSLQ